VKIARLQLGDEQIELMEFHSAAFVGRKIPVDSRSNDLWFQHIAIVVSDMQKAYQLLLDHDVTHVSTSPQTLPEYLPGAAGISAFYFRDPDGHNLELIHYPENKGNSKWHEPNQSLFMGIDHTAIAIDLTNSTLDFYQDFLGMKIAGKSENYGTEQEHLNQVFGARLKITGLKAASGFELEFLDYIAPPGGRHYPPDTRPNDLWYWQTSLKSANVDVIYKKAISAGYEIISSGIVTLNDQWPGLYKGFIMRDPDGHALFIYE
jgi:catechol 2,3-dioxygenase-like lactoylglutathione lyase family enzyme